MLSLVEQVKVRFHLFLPPTTIYFSTLESYVSSQLLQSRVDVTQDAIRVTAEGLMFPLYRRPLCSIRM